MKVLMLTAGMSGGGTERVIAVLANHMVDMGHDVTILMTSRAEVAYELRESVKVVVLGGQTGGSIRKRMERLRKIRGFYREEKNRVVVSFGTETNLFALLAGVGCANKIIVSERNDPNRCGFPRLRNLLYRLADGSVFQTGAARECFPRGIQKKGIVIPNPLKEDIPVPYEGERTRRVVAVGRLQPQKNHRLLISAFAVFFRKHPEYELVIYGKGELEEELRALAEEEHVQDAVVFAGFSGDVLAQIRDAAIYVLSSDYEGISNSLMEAMAMGMPVVSTDCPIGGSALLIEDKANGLLVPVGDRAALADAMELLVENPLDTVKMAKKAREVKEKYSAERICGIWEEYIRRFA